jgi:UDP-N-acetylglucosamine--N-acetylmuramyl-(pentapeptide) pyrophosphoryl-undecaprenol N-acetylglucosamine transferase
MPKKFIFAGGGTGGHIYPAIAIASALKRHFIGASIIFVGTDRGLEKDLVPKAGFQLKKIRVKGFERKISLDTIVSIKEMFLGAFDSIKIIKNESPDLVVGTGGYVAGPVILFAALFGIPSIIHEQNVKPGMTNRILSHFVDRVAISFPDSKKYFPSTKTVLTGNPVRREICTGDRLTAVKKFGLDPNLPTVLCFGGSQGAARINDAMLYVIEQAAKTKKFQIIHVTGQKHYDKYRQLLENKGISLNNLGHIKIRPYIYEMKDAYAACDLVISRAGAISISEITLCGKPSILIPLPNAADNHQDFNARYIKENSAGIVIKDKFLTGKVLLSEIEHIILNRERLESMAQASKRLGNPKAIDLILNEIIELIK